MNRLIPFTLIPTGFRFRGQCSHRAWATARVGKSRSLGYAEVFKE